MTDDELASRARAAHRALLRDHARLDYLYGRGIPLSVVEEFGIGWSARDQRYSLPVHDSDGAVVNIRRYRPGDPRKMLNTPGYGTGTRLYPAAILENESEWVLYAGGEWDALSAIAEGLVAVCGTNGEGSVPAPEALDRLRGRRVAILLDNDAPGRKAATRLTGALARVAQEVRDVRLPREGMDLNDWFAEGNGSDALERLIEDTPRASVRRDATELLRMALDRVRSGESRNETGLWLACQLRDERYSSDEAWSEALAEYQSTVESLKEPHYRPEEARATLASAYAHEPRDAVGARQKVFAFTDMGNAERLVARHGADLRHVPQSSSWLVWDERRWRTDSSGAVMRWAKATARSIPDEVANLDDDRERKGQAWARASESRARLDAAMKLAETESSIPAAPGDFDADPLSLNVRNGILDLRTGQLGPHTREAMCRRLVDVDYDPSARAPGFEKFLADVQPDPAVREFLQRAVGYSLTGKTDEQKLLLLYGTGSNGKSTFVELMQDLLGDYAEFLPSEALVLSRGERIPNDIARLAGARFVTVMEFENSARLNERLVKQLTGSDTISARFMRQEWFNFRPQCTIWVSSNHHPVITGTDDGIWRRFLVVDFPVKIPDHALDRDLGQRLRDTELPGILRWAVEGALAWQRSGLNPPVSVLASTSDYRADSDVLGEFFEESATLDPDERVSKNVLFECYAEWCRAAGLRPMTKIALGRVLKERYGPQVAEDRVGRDKVHVWLGIGLRERQPGPIRVVEDAAQKGEK